jgi:hypothetical protein
MKSQNKTESLPVEFKTVFCLAHSFEVFIPSTINVNESCDNTEFVNIVAAKLSSLNGGATIYNGIEGCWNSDNAGLVKESVTVIYSAASDFSNAGEILNLCRWLKSEMSQEAISLKIDGKLFLI